MSNDSDEVANVTFNPLDFAIFLMTLFNFITPEDSKIIHVLKDGIYKPIGEIVIQKELVKKLGRNARLRFAREVSFTIQAKTYLEIEKSETLQIAVENGILNPITKTLEQFNPRLFITVKIPVTFNPNANCPKILNFLTEVVGKQQLSLLQEMIGYLLLKKMPFHKSILLIGEGANGKTTVLNLIIKLLGEENCVAILLQDLCHSPFAAAQLYGKLANIADDLPNTSIKTSGKWKMITGGARVMAQFKHRPIFHFWPYAKHIFSANSIPFVYEDSVAWWRRWIIIVCNNQFIEGINANENILEDISSPEELSGFLNWALEGLERLLKNKKFSINHTVEQLRDLQRKKADSAGSFIEECIGSSNSSECFIPFDDYYQSYVDYCQNLGLPIRSKRELTVRTKAIHSSAQKARRTIDGERVKVWNYLFYTKKPIKGD